MMSENEKDELFDRYLSGTATHDEIRRLEQWLDNMPGSSEEWAALSPSQKDEYLSLLYRDIKSELTPKKALVTRLLRPLPIAAGLILIFSAGWFLNLLLKNAGRHEPQNSVAATALIVPGGDFATLQLSDGRTVLLDSASSGQIADEHGVLVSIDAGALTYQSPDVASDVHQTNTIATPKGGQYMIRLEDGTRVWLNAASSLKFPVSFGGGPRTVVMEGECYFDVAHTGTPFIVHTGDAEIRVLGTEFNVQNYRDESAAAVTLREGSVEVSAKGRTLRLQPGQQAVVYSDRAELTDNVNTDAVIAWKTGYFSFNNDNLTTVMRQLSRWYDVDVVYEGRTADEKFSGEIGRKLHLNQVLNILGETGIGYRLDGRKIIVTQ